MRFQSLIILLFVCGLAWAPRGAGAQAVAAHQAATAAVPAAKAPAAAAIIPGSPLAVLTAAASTPPVADTDTPAPFGTGSLGLSLTSTIGEEASFTLNEFTGAVRRSTNLAPVLAWLQTVYTISYRRADTIHSLAGLIIVLAPALAAEAAIRLALARPRLALVARAAKRLAPVPPDGLAGAQAGETEKRPRRRLSVRAWLFRSGLAVLHLLLALLPLFGFALAAGLLLGTALITTRQARLAVIGVSNAYLFARLALEFLRLLFAPKAPPLRLLHCTDFRAFWALRWAKILLFTGSFGYGVVLVAEILGLPQAGAVVLTRIIALAVHVELAIAIWQSRKVVAHWIAGDPTATGITAGFRQRLARVWHFLALFYVLALWIAWAGGVRNAFGVLLRLVLVFLAALIFGRAAWSGSAHLLERLFPETATNGLRQSAFFDRARTYNPLLRGLLRLLLGLLMLVLIMQGWGLNVLPWLLRNPLVRGLASAFIAILITVAVALFVWEYVNAMMNGRIARLTAAGRIRQASRLQTLQPMLKATVGVAISLIAGLICLSKIGVNAAPLLAGAGVLGIAIGFGSQKLVQDIITGLFLLLEDAIQVGDVVSLAGMTGSVERLSIRTIRLRGGDGSINIIPFSAVTTVTNMTRDFGYAQISIQVGYDEDLERVTAVLTDIGRQMRAEPTWGAMMRDDLQIFGLDQFGAAALVITGQIRTGPGQHWSVRREFYARVQQRFAQEGIVMPYTSSSLTINPAGLRQVLKPMEEAMARPASPPAPGAPPPADAAA